MCEILLAEMFQLLSRFLVSKIIPLSIESGPKRNDLVKKDAWSCNSDIFMMKPNFLFIQTGTFEQHVWLLNWNIVLNQTSLLPETTSIPHA
jgi:hypothetical protein